MSFVGRALSRNSVLQEPVNTVNERAQATGRYRIIQEFMRNEDLKIFMQYVDFSKASFPCLQAQTFPPLIPNSLFAWRADLFTTAVNNIKNPINLGFLQEKDKNEEGELIEKIFASIIGVRHGDQREVEYWILTSKPDEEINKFSIGRMSNVQSTEVVSTEVLTKNLGFVLEGFNFFKEIDPQFYQPSTQFESQMQSRLFNS